MDFSNLSIARPPQISSEWKLKDYLGALRVRFSIGRNRYRVKPGLYRLGEPGKDSEVFVTANYKLSFDLLRKHLKGIDAWILVLDTYGINVWCAAGKGTFGSEEMIRQIRETRLELYVLHKRLIVPQLGAPGVSVQKVRQASGFSIRFGPVRAADIHSYLASGYSKDDAARKVEFKFRDRLILCPVELVNSLLYLFISIVLFVILSGLHTEGFSFEHMWEEGLKSVLFLVSAYLSGAFLAPLLLPILPFRYFGGKGLLAGFLVSGAIVVFGNLHLTILSMLGWLFLSGAISSYLTMNFTGSSTYTSLSGVRKEMRIFVPIQLGLALCGLSLVVISKLL